MADHTAHAAAAARAPLPEDVLRSVRAALIKTSRPDPARPETETENENENETHDTSRLFSAVLHTAQTPTLTQPHRALSCDVLSTWLTRARTHPALRPPPAAWAPLVALVATHFDSAQSALSKALKGLLCAVLALHPAPSTLAPPLVAAVHKGAATKASYYVLEALLRRRLVTAEAVIAHPPGGSDVVGVLLGGMRERTVAPAIGRALVALLGARRAEVAVVGSADADADAEWVREWGAAVEGALACEALRGNVQTYVLPGLFRLSQAGFRAFVDGLGLARCSGGGEKDENVLVVAAAAAGEEDAGKAQLMGLLCCLKVGKDLGYVAEEGAEPGSSKKPTTTVPASFTTPLLSHAHAHVRLAALTLLTYSPAPTQPLPPSTLAALRRALPPLHTESDAEVRNQTTQALRTLLARLAASSYHLAKTHHAHPQLAHAKAFTAWYLRLLQTQLHPGSSYQRATTALRLLPVLAHPESALHWPEAFADVCVFAPGMRRVLVDALFDPFDDVRALAADVLQSAPAGAVDRRVLAAGVHKMDASGRERDADGVARVVALLARRDGDGAAGVLADVVGRLEACLGVAREDFQAAVRGRPVHGWLAGLRMVLEGEGAWAAVSRGLVERVLAACGEVWGVASGVLCVDSPEGCVPGVEEGDEDEEVNSRTVMSYSWRAVKESSSLLATVLSRAPYDPASPATSLLQPTDFSTAGALLLSQLSHIRHRGAFSAVSPSFAALCALCFASRDPALRALPPQWLSAHLDLITAKSASVTRRSAGLPYLLLGILASEPDPARPLLAATFAHLAAVAALPAGDGDRIDLPQVHALNCIKHLFTDARMAAAVAPYAGRGLALAVDCFGARAWALRNCGIMLFTALLNRLLGARGGAGAAAAVEAQAFFARYPGVREVLLRDLRAKVEALDAVQGAGDGAVETVYPALSLVARLGYSAGGGSEMAEFVGCVRAAMECRVWKVREMAARAYASLVGGAGWQGVVERLLAEAAGGGSTNAVHGRLCAVRALLERKRRGGGDLAGVWRAVDAAFDALVRRSRCAVVRAVCLQIITEHGLAAGALAESDALHAKLLGYADTAAVALAEIGNAGVVGRTLFKTHLTAFMVAKTLRYPTSERIGGLITLLNSNDEEAALSVTELLLESSRQLDLTPKEAASLDRTLWALIAEHPWDQLRTAALRLIYRCGGSETNLEANWRTALDLAATPPTEPCKDAALAALGLLTARVWAHFQPLPSGDQWAEWCLGQLLALVKTAAHEDQPYPARESALQALKALSPILHFDSLSRWRSEPAQLRGAYTALYDLLNDDDEDLRDAAAAAVCALLPGPAVSRTPLRAGDALLEAMVAAFGSAAGFLHGAAQRLRLDVPVEAELERLLAGDTALFAREKQNLFVNGALEAQRWGRVLASLDVGGMEERTDFVRWVAAGLAAFGVKVREKGREGALGWLGDEEAFVLGVRVIEGVRAVKGWHAKGCVEDALWERVVGCAQSLVEALTSVEGHEGLKEGLIDVLSS